MLISHARHAPSAALAERGGCGSCNSEVSAHEELRAAGCTTSVKHR